MTHATYLHILTRKTQAFADDPTFRQDSRSKYISKARWEAWNKTTDAMVTRDPSLEARKALMDFYTKGLEITSWPRPQTRLLNWQIALHSLLLWLTLSLGQRMALT